MSAKAYPQMVQSVRTAVYFCSLRADCRTVLTSNLPRFFNQRCHKQHQ